MTTSLSNYHIYIPTGPHDDLLKLIDGTPPSNEIIIKKQCEVWPRIGASVNQINRESGNAITVPELEQLVCRGDKHIYFAFAEWNGKKVGYIIAIGSQGLDSMFCKIKEENGRTIAATPYKTSSYSADLVSWNITPKGKELGAIAALFKWTLSKCERLNVWCNDDKLSRPLATLCRNNQLGARIKIAEGDRETCQAEICLDDSVYISTAIERLIKIGPHDSICEILNDDKPIDAGISIVSDLLPEEALEHVRNINADNIPTFSIEDTEQLAKITDSNVYVAFAKWNDKMVGYIVVMGMQYGGAACVPAKDKEGNLMKTKRGEQICSFLFGTSDYMPHNLVSANVTKEEGKKYGALSALFLWAVNNIKKSFYIHHNDLKYGLAFGTFAKENGFFAGTQQGYPTLGITCPEDVPDEEAFEATANPYQTVLSRKKLSENLMDSATSSETSDSESGEEPVEL